MKKLLIALLTIQIIAFAAIIQYLILIEHNNKTGQTLISEIAFLLFTIWANGFWLVMRKDEKRKNA